MTVTTTANSISYAGNGATSAFAFPYVFFEPTDLVVTLSTTSSGIVLSPPPVVGGVAPYDYTVSGVVTNGEFASGATVTFNTAPAGDTTVAIVRSVPATQEVTLIDNTKFPAQTVNVEFDKLTVLAQQGNSQDQLALHIPAPEFTLNTLAAPSALRRSRVLAWDNVGNLIHSTRTLDEIENLPNPSTPLAGIVNAKAYGAVGDGVADDTAALQTALGTGHAVFLPRGNYRVTNMLTIPHGSGLFGETKHFSRLIIPQTFNLSATGVVVVTQPSDFFDGQAVTIRDITFDFSQPDTAVRAGLVHYPPAIFMPNASRVVIHDIRILRGWNGLWMDSTLPDGSIGGCWIDLLEASCFNKAIYMDDALDVMHVSRIHLWDFGLTTNQTTVFRDGNTIGLEAGRVDDLQLSDFFAIFMPKAIWMRSGARNWPGLSWGQFSNITLDNSGMVLANGTYNIANLYLAPGSYTARSLIVAADSTRGAIANISSLYQRILEVHASNPTETVLVDGVAGASHLNITGMTSTLFLADVDVSHVACNQSAGHVASLSIAGGRFGRFDSFAPTRPTIDIRGGRASLTNITGSDKSAGTGNIIRVTADNWVLINNVTTLGWQISLPANARFIDHDTYPVRQTYTPTVTAQTGTFTSVSGTGRYTLHGKFLKLEVLVSIVTNGTAATGVVVSLPSTFTSAACYQVMPGREVTSSGAMLQAVIAPSSTFMVINTYVNGYPGATGYNLAISGEIEIT